MRNHNLTYSTCNNTQLRLFCECILIEMVQNKCWFYWFLNMITIKFQKMCSSSPIIFISTRIVLVRFILVHCVLFKVGLRDQKIIALEMTHELTLLILFTFRRIFLNLLWNHQHDILGCEKKNSFILLTIPKPYHKSLM